MCIDTCVHVYRYTYILFMRMSSTLSAWLTHMFAATRWPCWFNWWCGTRSKKLIQLRTVFRIFWKRSHGDSPLITVSALFELKVGWWQCLSMTQCVVLHGASQCCNNNLGYGLCLGGWVGHCHNYMCIVMWVHAYSYPFICFTVVILPHSQFGLPTCASLRIGRFGLNGGVEHVPEANFANARSLYLIEAITWNQSIDYRFDIV